MTYLNVKNKSIQYEKNSEWLVELEFDEDYIESLTLEEVRDIIKIEIDQIIDYKFNYQ